MDNRSQKRNRDLDITRPVPALPGMNDPIWKKGHEVVALLADYLADVDEAPVKLARGTGRMPAIEVEGTV